MGCDRLNIKVCIGFGEVKYIAVEVPIPIPAMVPSLNKYAIKTVLGGKIHVAFDFWCGGAVAFAAAPSIFANMHTPPNPDILTGFYPVYIA